VAHTKRTVLLGLEQRYRGEFKKGGSGRGWKWTQAQLVLLSGTDTALSDDEVAALLAQAATAHGVPLSSASKLRRSPAGALSKRKPRKAKTYQCASCGTRSPDMTVDGMCTSCRSKAPWIGMVHGGLPGLGRRP